MLEWEKISAVIFDVDGTLYDQRKLRVIMMSKILSYYLLRPQKINEINIIRRFRAVREYIAKNEMCGDIENAQYQITAQSLKISEEKVRIYIKKWILQEPLSCIKIARFPFLKEFCYALKERNIRMATFSDYPSKDKIAALGLPRMITSCSTDSDIDCLKPSSKGLIVTIKKVGATSKECLLIGDSEDKDAECAKRIGVRYLIKKKKAKDQMSFTSYRALLNNLIGTLPV